MKRIKIDNKCIGEKESVFIIAEAGVNHCGQFDLAIKLIDEAAKIGADAIKFQTFITSKLVSLNTPVANNYQRTKEHSNQYQMLKKLELSKTQFIKLKKHCDKKKIIFLSTPFDKESADFLEEIGVPAYKISSGDLTDLLLITHIAKKGKPMIISTGMATIKDVRLALAAVERGKNKKIILLHCTSSYPAPIEECHLRAIYTLKEKFKVPVGYSDHTSGIEISLAAVSLGAKVIEKHFTLNKFLPGPDHKASLEVEEFKKLIEGIRKIEKALGDAIKKIQKSEKEISLISRKSIVATRLILPGEKIKKDMIGIKRPGIGIPPKYFNFIMGKRVKKIIQENEVITWEKIERGRQLA